MKPTTHLLSAETGPEIVGKKLYSNKNNIDSKILESERMVFINTSTEITRPTSRKT